MWGEEHTTTWQDISLALTLSLTLMAPTQHILQSVKISQFDGRSVTHHHVPECVCVSSCLSCLEYVWKENSAQHWCENFCHDWSWLADCLFGGGWKKGAGHSHWNHLSILSIPPLIPAGMDRNPAGIDREYCYLGYILRFYFKHMFWRYSKLEYIMENYNFS